MTDQEPSSVPAKRCMFCGSELPDDAKAPPSRWRWLGTALGLMAAAIVLLILESCFGIMRFTGPTTANGIVIGTVVLNVAFSSYLRRR